MLDAIAGWTTEEMSPALRVLGELTMSAIDSVPLPLLVVVFLALLASLKPSVQPTLLPSYSPSLTSGMSEKTRLSPSPSSPPFFPLNPAFSLATTSRPPMHYSHVYSPALANPGASFDEGKSTYVAVADNPSSAVDGASRGARRGHGRRFGWDRRKSSALAVLEESAEEKIEV